MKKVLLSLHQNNTVSVAIFAKRGKSEDMMIFEAQTSSKEFIKGRPGSIRIKEVAGSIYGGVISDVDISQRPPKIVLDLSNKQKSELARHGEFHLQNQFERDNGGIGIYLCTKNLTFRFRTPQW